MGKVMPVDDTPKLKDFMLNTYELFSKSYDLCKNSFDKINDIALTGDIDNNSFSVKLYADFETIENIKKSAESDNNITIQHDIITIKK